jgi:hypothetical protein
MKIKFSLPEEESTKLKWIIDNKHIPELLEAIVKDRNENKNGIRK